MFAFCLKFFYIFPRFVLKYSLPSVAESIMKRDSSNLPKITSNAISKEVVKSNGAQVSSSGSFQPVRSRSSRPGPASSTSRSSSVPVDMSGELAQFVKNAVKQDQVVIFSKTYCPYCTMAKDVFKKLEKPFTVIELDKRDDGNGIQDILKEMTGARTVPRVFLNGECIGGGTDVQALYDNGSLQNMIVKPNNS